MWRILDYGKHTLDEVLDTLEFYVRFGAKVLSITAPCPSLDKSCGESRRISIVLDLPLVGTT